MVVLCVAITDYLPMSLATKNLQKRWERQKKRRGHLPADDDDLDLFSRDRKW
jgi:hypothetical protein